MEGKKEDIFKRRDVTEGGKKQTIRVIKKHGALVSAHPFLSLATTHKLQFQSHASLPFTFQLRDSASHPPSPRPQEAGV